MKYPMIEVYRLQQGWTCSELASLLCVSRSTFYNWRKKGGLPLAAVRKLCDLFHCSPSMLLSRVILMEDPTVKRL